MLLNRSGKRDAASSRSPSPSPNFKSGNGTGASPSKLKADPSLSVLKPPSPRAASTATSTKQNTKIPSPRPYSPLPHPSTSRAPTDKTNTHPGSQSPRTPPRPRPPPTRQRVPSRTQLRQATAARQLSSEELGKDVLPDEYSLTRSSASRGPAAKEDMFWSAIRSTMRMSEQKGADSTSRPKCRQAKRKEVEPTPVTYVKPLPYLRKTLEAAGVGLMADSASMETLMGNKDLLKASFLTPQSVLDIIDHDDIFYHVWVAAMLAMEELPIEKYEFEEVLKLAFTKFLIELGSAIVDCLEPGLPLYTFVDPRKIMHPEGVKTILEQAVIIVEGLEKKGVERDRIYVSIPGTEIGLAIAKDLKERHGIKTNLVFVSGLAQAAACAAAGAAAITMPVDSILTYHERRRGFYYTELNPHPGRQNIKATACYMKHHKLETQVIASGLRSLREIEHCSALDSVCLADFQIETTKWHRMRVNRPPGPSSTAMACATQAPFPPRISEDERGFRYFSGMSPETRNEATEILQTGLKGWQDASTRIVEVLRSEMQRQVDAYKAPPPPPPAPEPQTQESPMSDDVDHWDYMRDVTVRTRCLLSSRETGSSENTLNVEFPRTKRDKEFEAELDKLERRFCSGSSSSTCSSVPPSPYMQDLDSFEPGSSSDEDSTDDMVIF